MKFFIAFALMVAVASASPSVKPAVASAPDSNAASLVQLIVNINAAGAAGANPVTVDMPVVDAPIAPGPLPVGPSPAPVQVIDTIPMPVQVVDTVPMPVQVVDTVPEVIVPEPISVAEPILPVAPAVVLPEILN